MRKSLEGKNGSGFVRLRAPVGVLSLLLLLFLFSLALAAPAQAADSATLRVEANVGNAIDIALSASELGFGTITAGETGRSQEMNVTVRSNYPSWSVTVRGDGAGHMTDANPGGTATLVNPLRLVWRGIVPATLDLTGVNQRVCSGNQTMSALPQPLVYDQSVLWEDLLASDRYAINVTFEAAPD